MVRMAVGVGMVLSVAACISVLPACSNSILGNAAEAGFETLLEEPLPTPTVPVTEQSGAGPPR